MTKSQLKEEISKMMDLAKRVKQIGDRIANEAAEYGDDAVFDALNQIQDCELTDVSEAVDIIAESTGITDEQVLTDDNFPEFKGQLVDIFEDFCEEQGISIENEDREEYNRESGYAPGENAAIIFGDDYDDLTEAAEELVNMGCEPFVCTSQVTNVALDTIARFKEILDLRGSRPIAPPEATELMSQIIDLYRKWGVLK